MPTLSHAALLGLRYARLRRSQWWTWEIHQHRQLRSLRRLLLATRDNVRFFHDQWANIRFDVARDMLTLDDLRRLPVLDKQALLAAPLEDRLVSGSQPANLVRRYTSGSTAEPFEVYLSPYEKDARVLLELRMLEALGSGPRDLLFEMRRQSEANAASGLVSYLGLFPRIGMTFVASPRKKFDELSRSGARVFKAHLSTLVPVAEMMIADKLAPPPALRAIVSCGEFLDPPSRRLVQQAFGVPVYDQYGAVEFGFVAWECPQGDGLHVSVEDFILEILDANGEPCSPGTSGEIVITALRQQTMPLIRFRIGDRASWVGSPCPCGRGLPRMRMTLGRTMDQILRADGTEVSGHFFTTFWEGIEGMRQFQIIQETMTRLVFRYVPLPGADSSAVETAVHQRLAAEMGPATEIAFDRVALIPPEVSGKLKYLHSRVAKPISQVPD